MTRIKFAAPMFLIFLLGGCAQMSYRQKAALTGAAAGAVVGGAIGGGSAAATGDKNREGLGGGIGAASGALIGGLLGYMLAEEPKPTPPSPAPPPPPTPKVAPPPAPKPSAPPAKPSPPPPPLPPAKPAPKVERTIILDHVLFDFDKTGIKPDGAKILDRLAKFLNENPDKKVDLEGHTDWIGTEKYNQGLSERRAAAVKNYLMKKGIDPSRIATRGFGKRKPIADNKTEAGRAKNRRVEVQVR